MFSIQKTNNIHTNRPIKKNPFLLKDKSGAYKIMISTKIVCLEPSRVNYSMIVQRDCPKHKKNFKPCDRNI